MLKLVKALDLQHWADTKESEALMPELMRRLVHASLKEITYVSFPNEDNVYMPGFDCEKWRGMACYWGDPTINPSTNPSTNPPTNTVISERVKRLLVLMDNSEYSLSQLMNLVNLKDRRSFTLNYLNPALENNVIVMTHPEQKNHRDQRYRKV